MNVHSSTIHNSQKVETAQKSITVEQQNKMWYIKQWNIFSMTRNEMLIPATRRMNFENTVLSDKNQTQKGIYCMISFA